MKRFMITAAAAALTTTAAFAAVDMGSLDTDGDNFASKAEVMAAYPNFDPTFFDDIDANDDNRLSAPELNNAEAQDIFARAAASGGSTNVMADADGDGFVSKEELMAAVPNFMESDFDSLDTNDDNRLSAQELDAPGAAELINSQGAVGTTMGLADLDTNGDNFLDFAELSAGFSGIMQESFNDIDTNDDGRISANELEAPGARSMLAEYQ
ncbi:EF-hand domain-containing protein [Oceaniglobus trochenteri]|uniref:EF-hand domain-containing protein n=1 Tax=Oceaniglobus trochenteri TaxID=2763260 RepID=UPI001CFF8118|nr:hypothetical protein [Oceaniglobus trochenteri]